MLKRVLVWTGILFASHVSAARQRPATPIPQISNPGSVSVSSNRAVVDRYCVSCHNERSATAGLMLDKADVENVADHAEVWEKVVQKLRTGAMPPAGRPRPDKATNDSLTAYLVTKLDAASAAMPNPGRSVLRRMNRTEYANAIRDLLGVEVDSEALLPVDEVNHGFDNIGDALSVTPVLMERYMYAARKISRMAVGEPEISPFSEKYELHKFLTQEDRMGEDLPFGSRGGTAVRHHFPLDGEYTIRVFLQRNSRHYIRGLADPHDLDFRVDGKRINVLVVGGGEELKGTPGPPFSQAARIGDPIAEAYEYVGAEESLEVRFPARAGTRTVGVTFMKKNTVPEGVYRPPMTQFQMVQYKGGEPAIDNIVITGPYNAGGVGVTPSREKIFVCHPSGVADEAACAGNILSRLARRAYRRPVAEKDVQTLLRVYQAERQESGFEVGIQAGIERIISGPEFLFRIEQARANTPSGSVYRISELELATRLSFFLWSSIPDDQLLDIAESGKLSEPAVLEQQARRMLADSRAKTLVTNFAAQWLYLRNLGEKSPDPKLFPEFDENLRDAFVRETELFVESTLREDQSVLRLLDARYTFMNERLARHYGVPNVYGSHFRRVTLGPEFDQRRGLLGHGSLLTVTSYANRTSVVLRGKWLMENILGSPPPPPPPNVPALEESGSGGQPLPLRQLMEKHRANQPCAACHAPMDPLGFALENFDAIGRWRVTDAGVPVDSSGVLPDGTKLDGPAGLRNVLLSRPEEFALTVTERMLTYALGRAVEYYDAPAIRRIVRDAAKEDHRWSSLVLGTVKSMPFQMRRSQ